MFCSSVVQCSEVSVLEGKNPVAGWQRAGLLSPPSVPTRVQSWWSGAEIRRNSVSVWNTAVRKCEQNKVVAGLLSAK